MEKDVANVNYCGVDLEVEFFHSPYTPSDYFHPSEGGFDGISSIYVGGVDIRPMLTDDQEEEIKQLLIDILDEY